MFLYVVSFSLTSWVLHFLMNLFSCGCFIQIMLEGNLYGEELWWLRVGVEPSWISNTRHLAHTHTHIHTTRDNHNTNKWILCASNQFSVICLPVGSIWQLFFANWASARQLFALKWQQGPAHLSWRTPSISSSLRFASASLWCLCLSSCATSERLASSNHPHLLHEDTCVRSCCLIEHQPPRLLMVII